MTVLAIQNEAAIARRDAGEIDTGGEAAGLAEHHIAFTRAVLCVPRPGAARSADDQIGEPVAVDVPRRGDGAAGAVVIVASPEDEPAIARRDGAQAQSGAKAARFAEHDIALARLDRVVARHTGITRAHDQIGEPIAVDVARPRHRESGLIAALLALEREAAIARRDGGEVDAGAKPARLAKHHIALTRLGRGGPRRAGIAGADDEIVEAIAIDVARRGDGNSGERVGVLAAHDETARAGGDGGEIDAGAKPARLAEHDIPVPGMELPARRPARQGRADDQVGEPVAVDVPRRGHREAGLIAGILPEDDKAAGAGGDGGQVDR